MSDVDTVLLPLLFLPILSSLLLSISIPALRRLNPIVWTCACFDLLKLIDITIVRIHCIVQKIF